MNSSQDLVDLRVRRTHKLLWEALMALMTEQEFETISVKDICDRAMVHRTTFYKHFEDKYDLLTNGIRAMHEPLAAEMDLLTQDTSGDLLLSYVVHLFAHIALHEQFYRAMFCGNGVSSFQAWLRNYLAASIAAKMQWIEQAGRAFPVPVPMLAQFYAGALLSTFAWWLSNDRPYSPEVMGRSVRKLLIEVSPPDHKQ